MTDQFNQTSFTRTQPTLDESGLPNLKEEVVVTPVKKPLWKNTKFLIGLGVGVGVLLLLLITYPPDPHARSRLDARTI
jgi:hypothetical protein